VSLERLGGGGLGGLGLVHRGLGALVLLPPPPSPFSSPPTHNASSPLNPPPRACPAAHPHGPPPV
jgi:hypothetical protein